MTPWLQDQDLTVWCGDALETLRGMADGSVDCCVTSPPYWGLRDYGTGEWDGGDDDCDHSGRKLTGDLTEPNEAGQRFRNSSRYSHQDEAATASACRCGARRVDRQLGLEPTPDQYVTRMVEVFREIRRVLAPHGTCWVNLGSSYFNGESYPLRQIDAVWLAAIVDGEGSIQAHRQRRPPEVNSVDSFQVDLSVGMVTPEVVQRCYEITGLGSCKQDSRGVWYWSCRGQQTARLLRAIYPYLLTKKKQAALAVMLADDLAERRYGRGNPAQPEVMEWREQLRLAICVLNQRRGTDFPITEPKPITLNLKPKDDVGIPHAVYHALRDDGWYARMDIVWAKPNPMPESVTDRPTKAHEYVFLLTRGPRYWFDAEAVREPHRTADDPRNRNGYEPQRGAWVGGGVNDGRTRTSGASTWPAAGRNVRSVWEIATQPYPEAHFATFPEELARRCIVAGCPAEVCRQCGKPRERIVESQRNGADWNANNRAGGDRMIVGQSASDAMPPVTHGWSDCGHNDYRPGVVLDPFAGSGTTAAVARKHGRHTIGIELNEAYCQLIARRTQQQSLFA